MMEDSGTSLTTGGLSRKVIAVAAAEAHTLALTGDGRVFSWGRGTLGRLGRGSEDDELFPSEVKFDIIPNGIKIVAIAAGAYHSLAVADDGSVWCWGHNIYGQLGISQANSDKEKYSDGTLVPCLMDKFLDLSPTPLTDRSVNKSKPDLKVCAVKAGGMTSLAIDNLGGLWIWGKCPQRSVTEEGNLAFLTTYIPTPVWDFHGHSVVKVACGNEHVVALVSSGETYQGEEDLVCFSWGNNSYGQLGLGDRDSRAHPEVVETFKQESAWTIYEVACGAFHTAMLTHRNRHGDTLDRICWTFGLGDKGQLGHGTAESALYPTPVLKGLPRPVCLISVDCGLFHTSVVSSDGLVWSWGMENGLGLCSEANSAALYTGDALSPVLCSLAGPNESKFPDPVQVACGAAHTVLIAEEGFKLWSWGRGRNGVLGNGKTVDCYTPTMVLWPPLTDDFRQEELKDSSEEYEIRRKIFEQAKQQSDTLLSSAMKELSLLQSKLSLLERYISTLHGSILGKPFQVEDILISFENSGTFDIIENWENMLDAAENGELIRLEKLYRKMLRSIKDKLLMRKIQESMKDSLQYQSAEN